MENQIISVVTLTKDKVAGGAPIFIVETPEELQQTAFILEKILNGMVHEITPQTLVIVRHH